MRAVLLRAAGWYLLFSGLVANMLAVAVFVIAVQRGPEWQAGKAEAVADLLDRVHAGSGAPLRTAARHLRGAPPADAVRVNFPAFRYIALKDYGNHRGRPGRVIRVGPGQPHARPSDAARVAQDGDTVAIAPGRYAGDVAIWSANRLTLRGDGGLVYLDAAGVALPQNKGIWLIVGDDVTVEHIEFSGARSPDQNGAGIRSEGRGLVIRNCYFHHNENGLLTNHVEGSEVVIEYSEFAYNGHPNGHAHNLYVGAIDRLTMRENFIHHAVIGSQVKSRARENYLLYNRIADAYDGRGNYSIDLSAGGRALIAGNVIQQGPLTENYHLVAFAPEGAAAGDQVLMVINNTLVNDRRDGRFVWNNSPALAYVYNNLFAGAGTPLRGEALAVGNVFVPDDGTGGVPAETLGGVAGSSGNVIASDAGFAGRQRLDYRVRAGSPAGDVGYQRWAPSAGQLRRARE